MADQDDASGKDIVEGSKIAGPAELAANKRAREENETADEPLAKKADTKTAVEANGGA